MSVASRVPGGVAGLLVAAVSLPALAADPHPRECRDRTDWNDFSAIAMTVEADAQVRGGGFRMTVEQTNYDDGMRLVGSDPKRRSEVIAVRSGDDSRVLASEPTAPREFGEIGMVYELPLMALSWQFHGLCEMADGAAYPVDIRQGQEAITGSLKRQGDSILFTLHEARERGQLSYVGSVSYHQPRGTLPPTLPVQGWTIFPAGTSAPEQGTTSPFKTLGEFEASLGAVPAPR